MMMMIRSHRTAVAFSSTFDVADARAYSASAREPPKSTPSSSPSASRAPNDEASTSTDRAKATASDAETSWSSATSRSARDLQSKAAHAAHKASQVAGEFTREVRARAAASGVDVNAIDEAAKEAARAARAAAREAARVAGAGNGGAGGTGGAGGGASWTSPRGLAQIAMDAVKEEYRLAMMDPGDAAVERRRAAGWSDAPPEPYDGTTAVAVTAAPTPGVFGKLWGGVKQKLGLSKVITKVEGLKKTAPYAKTAELAEDLRERWETSDSPMVHRIQDFQESMFTETEQGEAYRVIRQRDPLFNMSDFMAEVKRDAPKVLGAYLRGDVDALRATNISKEMLERLSGQMNLWKQEGQFVDPRILDFSDVELMEVRMMENEPLVVLTFSCQQINCVRDKSGKIVEGAEDDIQSVHYLWAMQLADKKFTTDDGREYTKPAWELRELVLRGMMSVAA